MVPENSFGKKVFVYSGKKLDSDWEDAGISLHFPDATFEKEIEISVEIVTNIDEQGILPRRYRLMPAASTPYKITASAPLPAPVTVRMEHCAVVKEENTLVLMVAHKGPPYNFEPLPGAKFPLNSFYGEVELEHFSLLQFFWNLLGYRKMQLSVHVLYHEDNTATFVVTKNLKDHIQAVKKITHRCYDDNIMECESTTNAITLSLPVNSKGWQITSNFEPAEIKTCDIDTYEPGQTCPKIKLCMEWKGSGEQTEERVSIPITGGSKTSFSLLCKPRPHIQPQPQVVQPATVTSNHPLHSQPTLVLLQTFPTRLRGDINIFQEIGIKYHDLGINLLKDDYGKITESFEDQYKHDSLARKTEAILQMWLQGPGRKPKSWNTLITVLREIQLGVLAKDIEDNLSQEEMYPTEYLSYPPKNNYAGGGGGGGDVQSFMCIKYNSRVY